MVPTEDYYFIYCFLLLPFPVDFRIQRPVFVGRERECMRVCTHVRGCGGPCMCMDMCTLVCVCAHVFVCVYG